MRFTVHCGLLAAVVANIVTVAAQDSQVAAHIAAAKAAAGSDFTGVFNRICSEAVPTSPRPDDGRGRGARPPGPPPRDSWHAEPVKVFDNLYFLGQTEYSVWAVKTSEGLILIDSIFDYSVDDEVVGGLKKMGLDPATIKYVVISHGHGDHSGGAKYLQDRFNAKVLLAAEDWDLLDRSNGTKPRRDVVAYRRAKADARRHYHHALQDSGTHAGNAVDGDPGERQRHAARGGVVGRNGVQLDGRSCRLHHTRASAALLVRDLIARQQTVQGGRGASRR
jgi:glyoxylase-like metal-dependent hydrolase (beta-lactamase superfamily II)